MSDDHDQLEGDIRALATAAQELAKDIEGPDSSAHMARAITTLLCAALGIARQCGVESEALEEHIRDLAPVVYVMPLESLN